jgi:nitrate reductase NapE component
VNEPSAAPSSPAPWACRNCGAAAPGRYCPACGQETALLLPTAGAFLREAAGRYVALDGRLARTLFHLLFRPGFLTNEYFAGRRRRYIRPARLFLVLALALFAVLRIASEAQPGGAIVFDDAAAPPADATASPGAVPARSGAVTVKRRAAAPPLEPAPAKRDSGVADSGEGGTVDLDELGIPWSLKLDGDLRATVVGPEGPLRDHLQQRLDRINRLDKQDRAEHLLVGVLRYGPYALIALLPWFALLLQIVYAGRRRRYPLRPRRYAEHLVFGAHNHAFACLALIVAVVSPWPPVSAVAMLWMFCYLLWSMKSVYGGRWSGVFVRAALIAVPYLTMFALVTAVLLVIAILLR